MADFKITQQSEDCGNYVKISLDFDDSDDSTNNEVFSFPIWAICKFIR